MSPVPAPKSRHGETPLVPAYSFNSPGQAISLYDGSIGGFSSGRMHGAIELDCGPKPGLRWKVEPEAPDLDFEPGLIPLGVHRQGLDWTIEGHRGGFFEGWINTAEFERPNALLNRVLVHWLNLPSISGPIPLKQVRDDVEAWWLGRWQTDVDGWTLVMDERQDYGRMLADAESNSSYFVTHVMQVVRSGGESFSAQSVGSLVECLRVSFSFAFGRWVAPAISVGYDSTGTVAWETWTSPICDPIQRVGMAWLYHGRPGDLSELVRCTVPVFNGARLPGTTRFQMCLAVEAVKTRFVEQRILAAAPILEQLAWATLVLGRRMTRDEYGECYAEDRLRFLLQSAGISPEIPADTLPVLARFGKA